MSTIKSTATNAKSRSKAERSDIIQCDPSSGLENRFDDIATSAYYKAEARQFVPGQELDDWLQAEQDVKGQ